MTVRILSLAITLAALSGCGEVIPAGPVPLDEKNDKPRTDAAMPPTPDGTTPDGTTQSGGCDASGVNVLKSSDFISRCAPESVVDWTPAFSSGWVH